jgi:hypothetical protein
VNEFIVIIIIIIITGANFPETGNLLKILRARWMKRIKLHAEDPQILDANVQNLVSRATWRPGLVEA